MDNFIKSASVQSLCEHLGYDEGKVYFNLINKSSLIKEGYSHSKSYRILKNLFESNALIKIKKNNKELFEYMPLPPSFLIIQGVNPKIIDYLEDIYLKNHADIFKEKLITVSLIGEFQLGLVVFLIKHFMKDYALVISGGSLDYNFLKKYLSVEKLNKIRYFCREDYCKEEIPGINKLRAGFISNKRIFIIDGKIILDLLRIPNENSLNSPEKNIYLGYFATDKLRIKTATGSSEYISIIEKELNSVLNRL